jgi:NAD(P)-dependent dehydrogenase (short-subunit alcohol dehydrogenase family)
MKRFEDRTVLITGGSSGIGLAAAQRIAAEGGRVVLLARDEGRLQEACDSLSGDGHAWRSCDVCDEAEVASTVKEIKKELGPLYAAVLSAGGHNVRPFAISKAAHFQEMYTSNVISAVNVCKAFGRAAHPEGSSIVLLSSAAALQGGAGVASYAAAKAALLPLARALSIELLRKKIRVNVIVAGVVETPMSDRFLGSLSEEQSEAIRAHHPLGIGKPEDVAAAVAFLTSEDARWITGTSLVIDGGLTAA